MRSKTQDIIKESNKVLGKLTDKQIENYGSDHRKNLGLKTINKNRNKKASSNGGKIGGRTTGDRIKNGEKIGIHAIPMSERIEKYYSKPRYNRRLLSDENVEYIKNVYFRPINQFQTIPAGKKTIKQLMNMFNVSKGCILSIINNKLK
jgi:hypothetical protein